MRYEDFQQSNCHWYGRRKVHTMLLTGIALLWLALLPGGGRSSRENHPRRRL